MVNQIELVDLCHIAYSKRDALLTEGLIALIALKKSLSFIFLN
jgi:hypothetical protein